MSQKQVYYVGSECCMCGDCLSACPVGAITLNSTGAVIDPGACLVCGRCAVGCRAGAITLK